MLTLCYIRTTLIFIKSDPSRHTSKIIECHLDDFVPGLGAGMRPTLCKLLRKLCTAQQLPRRSFLTTRLTLSWECRVSQHVCHTRPPPRSDWLIVREQPRFLRNIRIYERGHRACAINSENTDWPRRRWYHGTPTTKARYTQGYDP